MPCKRIVYYLMQKELIDVQIKNINGVKFCIMLKPNKLHLIIRR